jgi:hypothetical protein
MSVYMGHGKNIDNNHTRLSTDLTKDHPTIAMPPLSTNTSSRINSITTCLAVTADTLEILAKGLRAPFLEAISNTTQSLLKNIEVNHYPVHLGPTSHRHIQDCQTKQESLHPVDGESQRIAHCNYCSSYQLGYRWEIATKCIESNRKIY